ncbi:AAA family ATPase [Thiocystis violacea]|uniref:AAA family ATPase n=1 Tax=Thiocystis violacea TaxID=13725 RepID=UPI001F5B7057|nr:AAA family ATPase [Thiocystis violacea]
MQRHPSPWRTDFTPLSPAQRRLARYALNSLKSDPRLERFLHEREFLAALWSLMRSLLDPGALHRLAPALADRVDLWEVVIEESYDPLDEASLEERLQRALSRDEEDTPPPTDHPAELRQRLGVLLRHRPEQVLTALAEADDGVPISPVIRLLGEALELDATSLAVLDFIDQREQSPALQRILSATPSASRRANVVRLAAVLGEETSAVRAALGKEAPLSTLGLIGHRHAHLPVDLGHFLDPSDLLDEVLESAPEDPETLLGLLIEPAPAAAWRLESFPHLAAPAAHAGAVLGQAATTGTPGVNALFHGPPGTGKTELARALAAARGLRAFQVRSAGDDGDGLSRRGRLSAYLVAQRLLGRRHDALLIFDEVEDVFTSGDNLLALLHGESMTGHQKAWMNRILEENPVPAIWIANRTTGMDPAFLRRFLLPLPFKTPPRSVRRQMAERHLGDLGLPPDLLDTLAADAALAPAQLGAARRLCALRPDVPAEHSVREGVAALRTLLHGAPMPPLRVPATAFDVAYLNLAGGIAPSAIVQALESGGRGSLCFYGPPGTGKTAFAEVLAEALDRELVARQASDLLSPYVGETEQNLARLFREIDPSHTILLLDEVDSFLADRRHAQRNWERTQVNELLQQMERFPGIFIAATNLMSGIDAAALRRFDFKLHFRALTQVQRVALFAREALGDEQTPVAPELARHLQGLEGLTPGDFANVCRQRQLLGEALAPEQFLRRLAAECRLKGERARAA